MNVTVTTKAAHGAAFVESVDKGTLATLRREGQAQFTCAAKPRSERAFTKPGLAGFVIILRRLQAAFLLCITMPRPNTGLFKRKRLW